MATRCWCGNQKTAPNARRKRQTLDTLINEEALLLAKFLRKEKKEWNPRIPQV
jgi:hypothetical protein